MTRPHLLDPKARHVMLDVETLGLGWDVVVCSVGAVEFSLEPLLGNELDLPIRWAGSDGRIDPSTVAFWIAQSDAAREALLESQRRGADPYAAGEQLSDWMDSTRPDYIWTKGDLDHGAVRGWLDLYSVPYDRDGVWSHRRHRDCRALLDIVPAVLEMPPRLIPEVEHSAIGDARYQTRQLLDALSYIRLLEQKASR